MADALPLKGGQQDRLPEIEDTRDIQSVPPQRFLKLRLLRRHGRCGRRTDNRVTILRHDKHRAGFPEKFGEIVRLIVRGPFIEIGPAPKDTDTQIVQRRNGSAALLGINQGTDVDSHETWAIHSVRL